MAKAKKVYAQVYHVGDGSASVIAVGKKRKEFTYYEQESNTHFWHKMERWAKKQGATHVHDPESPKTR